MLSLCLPVCVCVTNYRFELSISIFSTLEFIPFFLMLFTLLLRFLDILSPFCQLFRFSLRWCCCCFQFFQSQIHLLKYKSYWAAACFPTILLSNRFRLVKFLRIDLYCHDHKNMLLLAFSHLKESDDIFDRIALNAFQSSNQAEGDEENVCERTRKEWMVKKKIQIKIITFFYVWINECIGKSINRSNHSCDQFALPWADNSYHWRCIGKYACVV